MSQGHRRCALPGCGNEIDRSRCSRCSNCFWSIRAITRSRQSTCTDVDAGSQFLPFCGDQLMVARDLLFGINNKDRYVMAWGDDFYVLAAIIQVTRQENQIPIRLDFLGEREGVCYICSRQTINRDESVRLHL